MRRRILEFSLPLLFFMLFDLLWYNVIGSAAAMRGVNYAPFVVSRLDTACPFLSVFIVPYAFTWILPLLFAAHLFFVEKTDLVTVRHMFAAFAVLCLLHCVLWLGVPVKTQFVVREFVGERSWNPLDRLTLFVHDHATLWNSLPALHVAAPWYLYRVAGLHAGKWSRALLVLTVVVAVSTMAIKIHYLADGLAGVICAEATFRVVFRSVSVRNTLARVNDVLYSVTYGALAALLLAAFVWS